MVAKSADRTFNDARFDRTISLNPVEWLDVRTALYHEASRIYEEACRLPPRLQRRRLMEERLADRLRQLAERFEC